MIDEARVGVSCFFFFLVMWFLVDIKMVVCATLAHTVSTYIDVFDTVVVFPLWVAIHH